MMNVQLMRPFTAFMHVCIEQIDKLDFSNFEANADKRVSYCPITGCTCTHHNSYRRRMPINEQTKKRMILYQKTSFSNQKEK
jgi:hypothetical protein